MDYEKKYKDAVKVAKDFLNSPRTCFDINQLKEIFPELQESEDERIRKEIVNFILYKSGHLLDEETEHRFVSYLEKQKEPIDPFDTN